MLTGCGDILLSPFAFVGVREGRALEAPTTMMMSLSVAAVIVGEASAKANANTNNGGRTGHTNDQ